MPQMSPIMWFNMQNMLIMLMLITMAYIYSFKKTKKMKKSETWSKEKKNWKW